MWWVPLAVAVITGPLVVLMRRFDRRNTEQHDRNMELLVNIHRSVDRVGDRVDDVSKRLTDHIEYHLDRDTDAAS
jgi:predicted metallo-beta-lactamase superfamily hydrolase